LFPALDEAILDHVALPRVQAVPVVTEGFGLEGQAFHDKLWLELGLLCRGIEGLAPHEGLAGAPQKTFRPKLPGGFLLQEIWGGGVGLLLDEA